MYTQVKNAIIAGLAFGLIFSAFMSLFYESIYVIMMAPFSGVFFGFGIYYFMISKTIQRQVQIESDAVDILHADAASHFVKTEAVGGKLYLLKDKIHFKSHHLNFHDHQLEIPLSEIDKIEFFNMLGLIPNGIKVTRNDGHSERFTVNNRKRWKLEMEKAMEQLVF